MNTIKHIRKNIFSVTQVEFAKIAGVTQGAVSFWENDEVKAEPSLSELQAIREAALAGGLKWDDEFLFLRPCPPTEGDFGSDENKEGIE